MEICGLFQAACTRAAGTYCGGQNCKINEKIRTARLLKKSIFTVFLIPIYENVTVITNAAYDFIIGL